MAGVSPKLAEAGSKPVPRVALLHLDADTNRTMRDIFKQFGVTAVPIESEGGARLQKEKFEAIVVRLADGAEELLTAARNSPSNKRVVIYGLATGGAEAMRFSKFGINAVLNFPLERQAALKVVRATHLLVIHELRRYVRIPIVLPVSITYNNRKSEASSIEISAGGMCLKSDLAPIVKEAQGVDIAFELPGTQKVAVSAAVCWRREKDGQFGVRFETADDRRIHVKRWIDTYLESLF
jgi:PilZ domain-containing protein